MLNLTKPTWKKSSWQAYQSLYYAQKLKPVVESTYQAYRKGLPKGDVGLSELAFRNKKCQELLELESDEVKAEVEKAHVANSGLETEGDEVRSDDNT